MQTFNIFNVITLLGGLALFLFGMNIMGDCLEKTSGSRLKSILENLTSNPFKGLLLGLGVTAIIQSSSATTVMVVGFVNSGIMKLSQSIGIIMGANVGTTVTSWLLSLSGIGDTGNVFLKFLKPSTFAPILAFWGIILYLFTKERKNHDIGGIFLGFAILMTGMETMSGAVKPLADMPGFQNILLMFSNPLLGILTGALITAIIQSSSASVGILQALAITGAITYSNAVPIILGQNIGTCVTAMISSVGTNKNARRTAWVHFVFNILGAAIFIALFYSINFFIGLPFIDNSASALDIAVIHTIFNVFSTLALFPFGKQLEKIAYLIVPEKGEDKKPPLLDERLLATPSVAVAQAKKLTDYMAKSARKGLVSALSLLTDYNTQVAQSILDTESEIDYYEDKLGTYLVRLSHENLTIDDSHRVSMMLHCIGDFERMSDHAVNIYEAAREINDKKLMFSGDAIKEIEVMTAALDEISSITINAFIDQDIEGAKHVEALEQVIDHLKKKMKTHHILRIQKSESTIETGFVFSDLTTNCERVADHCSNIAVYLIQADNHSFDTHEYLSHVKTDGDNDFVSRYQAFKNKYKI